MVRFTLLPILILAQSLISYSQSYNHQLLNKAYASYGAMSLDQKIGQLFMVAAYSGGDNYNAAEIKKLIKEQQIGGLIFMQGTAENQANLTNEFQQMSQTPLLIAMDAEWGLGMRLTGVKDYPKNLQVAAAQDPNLAQEMAKNIGEQCRRMGVHINFGPVVDINNNPDNPVINFRSFGEDKQRVSELGLAYAKGLEEAGVMSCMKHFPGHGDTDADSHKELPEISKTYKVLWENELYPFRQAAAQNAPSMMIAHLLVPSLTNSRKTPTTLSYECITGQLKKKMNYQGLIFTDALNMKAVADKYPAGKVDYLAFMAGNDVLLFSQDVPRAMALIKEAYQDGKITEERLRHSVVKILMAKYRYGAYGKAKVDIAGATAELNQKAKSLRSKIAEESITLARDQHKLMEQAANPGTILYVTFGRMKVNRELFANRGIRTIKFPSRATPNIMQSYVRDWSKYSKVILGVHGMYKYPKGYYGIQMQNIRAIRYLAKNMKNSCVLLHGNPYAIKYFCEAPCIMVDYEETEENVQASMDVVLNKAIPQGKLPVSVCAGIPAGSGISYASTRYFRPKPTHPAQRYPDHVTVHRTQNDIDPKELFDFSTVSNIAAASIHQRVFPGCQVLISKDGQIVYDKSFGNFKYESSPAVTPTSIYDIASVTKIAATTLAVMKLYEEKRIDLDARLQDYLPWTRGTNKGFVSIRNLLLHQGGLKSWIPFYKDIQDEYGNNSPYYLRKSRSIEHQILVAPGMFLQTTYPDTMWKKVIQTPLGSPRYVYSDLDFMFLQKVVEKISNISLDKYVKLHFYDPMGLRHTGYNPVTKGWAPLTNIVPTERDNYFRNQLIQGFVHDPGAAMLGGVAGHAGVFSTARDLYKILQMLNNGGSLEGKKYFEPSTIQLFTKYNSNISRRGLGFDKPDKKRPGGPTGNRCSSSTYGHQGFTGTCVWADPVHDVVFIFLSNRVYPSADNKKISRMDIRTRMQDAAYKAMDI